MRNYYSILEIDRSSDELEKLDRIAEVKPSLDEEYFDDLKTMASSLCTTGVCTSSTTPLRR